MTSLSALIVTSSSTVVFGLLTGVYLWFVRRERSKHDHEVGMKQTSKCGEEVS